MSIPKTDKEIASAHDAFWRHHEARREELLARLPAAVPNRTPSIRRNKRASAIRSIVSGDWAWRLVLASFLLPVVAVGLAAIIAWHSSARVSGVFIDGVSPAIADDATPDSKPPVGRVTCDVQPKFVAKITGLSGCQWTNDALSPKTHNSVAVGERFNLLSGLLEIKYNSGVSVRIEGPAVYEVSANGGHLAFGRLVADMAGRRHDPKTSGSARAVKEGSADDAPVVRVPSFTFVVRTPSTGVVDLDANPEFGISVGKDGSTQVLAFRGTVALCSLTDVVQLPYLVLKEGKAVQADLAAGDWVPNWQYIDANSDAYVGMIHRPRVFVKNESERTVDAVQPRP